VLIAVLVRPLFRLLLGGNFANRQNGSFGIAIYRSRLFFEPVLDPVVGCLRVCCYLRKNKFASSSKNRSKAFGVLDRRTGAAPNANGPTLSSQLITGRMRIVTFISQAAGFLE
jgi:hypothetical protein